MSTKRLKALLKLVKIIPLSQLPSKPFRILPVRKDGHRLVEWFILNPCWWLSILFSARNSFISSWITSSMIFEISGSNETGLQLDELTFLLFLKISLSLTLQTLGNVLWEIERLQISLIGLTKKSVSSFRSLAVSLSVPSALKMSILWLSMMLSFGNISSDSNYAGYYVVEIRVHCIAHSGKQIQVKHWEQNRLKS